MMSNQTSRQNSCREKIIKLIDPLWLCADSNGTSYLTVLLDRDGARHQEVHALESTGGHRLLRELYLSEYGNPPNAQAFREAVTALDAMAYRDVRRIGIRTVAYQQGFAIDLGDDSWTRAIVMSDGWTLVREGPLLRRGAGALALPDPGSSGSLEKLRDFVNVSNDADWSLILGWLVFALRPGGPYPILVLQGEQGSSKSTVARILVSLIDPNVAPLASAPRDDRELMVVANSRHVVALDNLSTVDQRLKDALCRLATGSGHVARKLYSDSDAVVWNSCRPIILNGIDDLVFADDLADRSISLTLPPIPENRRRSEAEIKAAFDRERPEIFGALLDAAASALQQGDSHAAPNLPRMADFAHFASAAAPRWGVDSAVWLDQYRANRQRAVEHALDGIPLVQAIQALLAQGTSWQGTVKSLLDELSRVASHMAAQAPDWPRNARHLSSQLRRLSPALRSVGISVEHTGRRGDGNAVRLTYDRSHRSVGSEHCEHLFLLKQGEK